MQIGVVRRGELVVLHVQPALAPTGGQEDGVLDGRVGLQRHPDPQTVVVHTGDGLPLIIGPRLAFHDRGEGNQLRLGHPDRIQPRGPRRLPPGLEVLGHDANEVAGPDADGKDIGLGPEEAFERANREAQNGAGGRAVRRRGGRGVLGDPEPLRREGRHLRNRAPLASTSRTCQGEVPGGNSYTPAWTERSSRRTRATTRNSRRFEITPWAASVSVTAANEAPGGRVTRSSRVLVPAQPMAPSRRA